jgi:hypothetical protein
MLRKIIQILTLILIFNLFFQSECDNSKKKFKNHWYRIGRSFQESSLESLINLENSNELYQNELEIKQFIKILFEKLEKG